MAREDYYQVLGVERGAGAGEIRRQYLAMAKRHHPDHEGDTRMMARLNEAYETLSNPQARFLYNNQLDDQEIANIAGMPTDTAVPARYREEPRHQGRHASPYARTYARSSAPHRGRQEKRSWAGRIFSFAATLAAVVLAGAFIAGHMPKQAAGALTVAQPPAPTAAADSAPSQLATPPTPTATASVPPTDGTLQPSTPAEAHYRCSLHYIASYKRMDCN
ncbi:MAG TPA: J domain-containing protein [Candidatus Saccharimonadales bacterium]|nr:J domain-containing protein [Candidatus Saccharimonadales bacterium]